MDPGWRRPIGCQSYHSKEVAGAAPADELKRAACRLTTRFRSGTRQARRNGTPRNEGTMTDRNETDRKKQQSEGGLSRRDFVRAGAAAGVGAAVLADPGQAMAQAGAAAGGSDWHYEFDVIVAGGGCAGLSSAIRAHDLGASVLVIDQNFDLGGRMLHSGAFTSLGGGDPVQQRDAAGEGDAEGFITVPPIHSPEELDDNVDLLFTDMTDWSIVDAAGQRSEEHT